MRINNRSVNPRNCPAAGEGLGHAARDLTREIPGPPRRQFPSGDIEPQRCSASQRIGYAISNIWDGVDPALSASDQEPRKLTGPDIDVESGNSIELPRMARQSAVLRLWRIAV